MKEPQTNAEKAQILDDRANYLAEKNPVFHHSLIGELRLAATLLRAEGKEAA